ncbi:MAG: site-specific integrase [Actinomycetota bacterium]|nr:site-specific integrase [Actinomycetota bacterium]
MSYQKRDGMQPRGPNVWRITVGQHRETFRGTKTDARKYRASLVTAIENGTLAETTDETLAGELEGYIASRVILGKVRPITARTYRGYVRNHVPYQAGSMRLSAVRPKHVQKILDDALAKGLKPRSVLQLHRILSATFRRAVKAQKIAVNPSAGVSTPEAKTPRLVTPSPSQVATILNAAEPEFRVPLAIAATTGLRRSEVLGLRWEQLHLDGDDDTPYPHLHVVAGLHRVDGALVLVDPKSETGTRYVPLPRSITAMLRSHRKEQAERHLLAGEAWASGDYVVDSGDGRPLDPDRLSKAFLRASRTAKVKGVRLHDLRHAWVTMQIGAGSDYATVSKAAGHATPGFTMRVYAHPNAAMAAPLATAAEDALGDALGGL